MHIFLTFIIENIFRKFLAYKDIQYENKRMPHIYLILQFLVI